MSDFDELGNAIRKMQVLLTAADDALKLPDRRAYAVKSMRIIKSDGYTPIDQAQQLIAKQMLATAEAEERRQGEVARDRERARLSVEIDQLRAVLPQLAAKATVHLGTIVRELR